MKSLTTRVLSDFLIVGLAILKTFAIGYVFICCLVRFIRHWKAKRYKIASLDFSGMLVAFGLFFDIIKLY